jgi:hypothetical protein
MKRTVRRERASRAYLAEHGMILSKDAIADAIPGLEIETNEVKATHSASALEGRKKEELLLPVHFGPNRNWRRLNEPDARLSASQEAFLS